MSCSLSLKSVISPIPPPKEDILAAKVATLADLFIGPVGSVETLSKPAVYFRLLLL